MWLVLEKTMCYGQTMVTPKNLYYNSMVYSMENDS